MIVTLTGWLAERGLTLSADKTRIVHLTEGFDFLGFTIRHYPSTQTKAGYRVRISPSKASVMALRQKVSAVWRHYTGTTIAAVIHALNPIIRGWANYFRGSVASKVFSSLDNWMFLKAVRWVNRTHPHQSNTWRKSRYWGPFNPRRRDIWVFGNKETGAYLLKFKWFKIERHIIVRGTASPDDPALRAYWAARDRRKARELPPSKERIARRQEYVCPVCGVSLFTEEDTQVHHKVPRAHGGRDTYDNLELVHYYCHQHLHARTGTQRVATR